MSVELAAIAGAKVAATAREAAIATRRRLVVKATRII
jgi:hypothetical protein